MRNKDLNYLVLATWSGTVLLFLVPELEIALPTKLRRVQVAPIARIEIPEGRVEGVSEWSTTIPDAARMSFVSSL